MSDVLLDAWNLLEPAERPEGMERDAFYYWKSSGLIIMDDVARDRLIVACEGVLLKLWWVHCNCSWYWSGRMFEDGCGIVNADRLTAAVLALRAEMGER